MEQRRGEDDEPKSLMLNTPGAAVEEALRCLGTADSSLAGLEERPWTAESTLERGDGPASVDMMEWLGGCSCVTCNHRKLEDGLISHEDVS